MSKADIKLELEELKTKNEAPDWMNWLSYNKLKTYLVDPQGKTIFTPKSRYRAIAKAAAKYLPENMVEEYEEKFFQLIWKAWLAPSTPIMSNLGVPHRKNSLAVSCSASYVGDSMWDIAYTDYEVAMLSKSGFGTAAFLDIRGGYENISGGGKTNPTLDWVEKYYQTQKKVSQNGTRRGSCAIYLDFWQKDLLDILPLLKTHELLHLGIVCDDSVKKALEDGNEEAMKRMMTILTWRMKKGKPYIIFIDNARRQDPQCYKKLGLSSKHSNLCIAGDQRIPTQHGLLTAKELNEKHKDLILFDNESSVEASSMKLREKLADVYEIELENGLTHKVTNYHGIATLNERGGVQKKLAVELKVGDKVAIQTQKGIFGTKDMRDEAYLLGLFQSDGTSYKDKIMIDIWENDFDLEEEIVKKISNIHNKYDIKTYDIKHHISGKVFQKEHKPATFTECVIPKDGVKKRRLATSCLKKLNFDKNNIPQWIWESNEETQWEYIKGLYLGDGTVGCYGKKGDPTTLSLSSIRLDLLKQVQLIMNNLGMQTSIHLLRKSGTVKFKGQKEYKTKDCYRLTCSNKNNLLEFNKNTGFLDRKNVVIEKRMYRDNSKKSSKVKSISYCGKEAVYCPTVYNDKHLFIANGILTFNCSEIFLHTDSDHTLSCVLSSMNGSKFDEWKNTDAVFEATIFLDCIAEDLIQRGSNVKGLERVVRSTIKGRALGLGMLGYHSYLQQNMIPFDSFQARMVNVQMFKHLQIETKRASKYLANLLGEPEWCKGTGLRNTHNTAIAPNTGSAYMVGAKSQGIEPFVANLFQQKIPDVGTIERINPELINLLKSKNEYTEENLNKIAFDKGSVQSLDCLSDHEKEVFKTAYEINQKAIIDYADHRQAFIDQGQSLNLFFSATEDEEWIKEVHKHAFSKEKLKALYYVRSQTGISADKGDECLACEG